MQNKSLEKDWILFEEYGNKYKSSLKKDRKSSIVLESLNAEPDEYATLMKSVDATKYRDKQIKFSAEVKAEKADEFGLWVRVDGPNNEMLAFDNMEGKRLSGSHNWKRLNILFKVHKNAISISYGLLQIGKGRSQIANPKLE
jgi:hypothetical protein